MGRGLDGYFWCPLLAGCAVLKAPRERRRPQGPRTRLRPSGFARFPVALAWGKHLFPFRTEQLSPTAPMVLGLHGPGRVGRRRFFLEDEPPPDRGGSSCVWAGSGMHQRDRVAAREHPRDADVRRSGAAGPGLGPSEHAEHRLRA